MRDAGNREVRVWCPTEMIDDLKDASAAMSDPSLSRELRLQAYELVAQTGAVWRLSHL